MDFLIKIYTLNIAISQNKKGKCDVNLELF